MSRRNLRLCALAVLAACLVAVAYSPTTQLLGLGALPGGGTAQAAAPSIRSGVTWPTPSQQPRAVRREPAPPSPGLVPRTGPPPAFKPLDIPNFGTNYRANTDTQSPNLAQQEPSIAVNPTNPLNVV